MTKPEINNEKIKKLLEEDEELRKANEKEIRKCLKEAKEIMAGKKKLTKEMLQEKIDWLYTLAELSNLKKDE